MLGSLRAGSRVGDAPKPQLPTQLGYCRLLAKLCGCFVVASTNGRWPKPYFYSTKI